MFMESPWKPKYWAHPPEFCASLIQVIADVIVQLEWPSFSRSASASWRLISSVNSSRLL